MVIRPSASAAIVAALLACSAPDSLPAQQEGELPAVGLMGTIPIYWGESDSLASAINGKGEAHWARQELERSYRLEPLDVLDAASLEPLDYLLLAQPRALAPAENVAVDAWVRQGGNLLLFADPMMTGESRFAIGDRRRPLDVALLSPLLGHWGLTLEFVEDQPGGMALREIAGVAVPVALPGRFVAADGSGDCTVSADGLLARCALGRGRATILADAAVLNLHGPEPSAAGALRWLVSEAFGKTGDEAGKR